jgi:hypothetical protein
MDLRAAKAGICALVREAETWTLIASIETVFAQAPNQQIQWTPFSWELNDRNASSAIRAPRPTSIKVLALSREHGIDLLLQHFQTRPLGSFQKGADMQFAKVQGSGLALLGLLLLLLQGFFLFSSTGPARNPAEISHTPPQAEHKANYLPGIIGLVALGFGGYLAIAQRKRGNEEVQPEKTPSGFPM